MMKVWVMHGIHEGELYASTHLTEKGAALAAIADVFDFLGIEDEESASYAMNSRGWSGVPSMAVDDAEKEEPFEWDFEKMKDMKRKELWTIFGQWSELTWDNSHGYQIEINKTEIQA